MKTLVTIFCLAMAVVALPGGAVAAETDISELLAFEMPRDGFMQDADVFAEVIPPRAVASEGLRTYSEALEDIYQTYPGRPEVHYFFCTVYYTPAGERFCRAARI